MNLFPFPHYLARRQTPAILYVSRRFSGAIIGPLPLKYIAASVTEEGRKSIELKQRAIEVDFPMDDELTQNGRYRPIVLGGDTCVEVDCRDAFFCLMSERSDSLFIIFCGCDTVEKAMFWAKKAATWINDNFFSKPMAVRFTMIFFSV